MCPKHQTNVLHLPLMSALHLQHITRPKLTRRHTEPANLKIKCSSGSSKKTHSTLSTCTNRRRGTIEHQDVYLCSDAVNAPRLVALTRAALEVQVQSWGGNAMVDESYVFQKLSTCSHILITTYHCRWSYTIQQWKPNDGRCFRVSVSYLSPFL